MVGRSFCFYASYSQTFEREHGLGSHSQYGQCRGDCHGTGSYGCLSWKLDASCHNPCNFKYGNRDILGHVDHLSVGKINGLINNGNHHASLFPSPLQPNIFPHFPQRHLQCWSPWSRSSGSGSQKVRLPPSFLQFHHRSNVRATAF